MKIKKDITENMETQLVQKEYIGGNWVNIRNKK